MASDRTGHAARRFVYIRRGSRYEEDVVSTSTRAPRGFFATHARAIRRLGSLASVLGTLLFTERAAHAVEKQHHLGLDPSLALLKVADRSSVSAGFDIGAHYTYGLSDMWNFMAEGGVAFLDAGAARGPTVPQNRPTTVARAAAGIGYVVDVIRWVPYVGVLVGGYHLAGGTLDGSTIAFGAQFAAGLDYQLTRRWTVGLSLRQHAILTNISDYPSYSVFGLKVETTWGF